MQSSNGDCPKRKGNYTGERLKLLRPDTYRRIVRLLAEPREHISIREICRQYHVTDDTVKAIEQREAVPIAARKQTLMLQAVRIAQLAADRVDDQIGGAPLSQAVVTFGVMTDKLLALSVEPSLTILHKHTHTHQHELVAALHAAVERIEKRAQADVVEVPALPAGRRVTTTRNAAQKAG
jgi:hypothetical protein